MTFFMCEKLKYLTLMILTCFLLKISRFYDHTVPVFSSAIFLNFIKCIQKVFTKLSKPNMISISFERYLQYVTHFFIDNNLRDKTLYRQFYGVLFSSDTKCKLVVTKEYDTMFTKLFKKLVFQCQC